MNTRRATILEGVITTIQKQWGHQALMRLSDLSTAASTYLSTGLAELDNLIDGIPVGRVTELLGAATSGKRTLTHHILATTQRNGGSCLYMDITETFDPVQATYHQVDVEKLVLIRPTNLEEAVNLAHELVTRCYINLIVIDAAEEHSFNSMVTMAVRRLVAPLGKQKSTLLLLSELLPGASPSFYCRYAALQLWVKRLAWLDNKDNVDGYKTQVTVARNKHGLSGQSAVITIKVNQL